MSVVLNYVSEGISVIMTDTRINYGWNQEFGYEDNRQKLIELPNMGWAAGVGVGDFLDNFKKSLNENEVTNTDQIIKLFGESINMAKKESPYLDDRIDKSVASVSWFGMNNNFKHLLRVGLFSEEHFGKEIALLNNNQIQILYPGEFVDEPIKAQDFETKHNMELIWNGDKEEILERMFFLFNEIAQESKYVSKKCEVGLHVLNDIGIFKYKISGDISELINAVKNDSFDSYIKTISSIYK